MSTQFKQVHILELKTIVKSVDQQNSDDQVAFSLDALKNIQLSIAGNMHTDSVENSLKFKLGNSAKDIIFSLTSHKDKDFSTVEWTVDGIDHSMTYSNKTVQQFFKEGRWVLVFNKL